MLATNRHSFATIVGRFELTNRAFFPPLTAGGAAATGAALITGAGAGAGVFFWVPISARRRSRSATEPTLSADGGGAAASSFSDEGLDIIMVAKVVYSIRSRVTPKKVLEKGIGLDIVR